MLGRNHMGVVPGKGSHNDSLSLKSIGNQRPVLQGGTWVSGHWAWGACNGAWGAIH